MGARAGTGAPRNTHKLRTQCGCEYGYKNHESLVTLLIGIRGMVKVILACNFNMHNPFMCA